MTKQRASGYSRYLFKVAEFYQKKEIKVYTNLILSLLTTSFFALFAIKPTMVTIASLVKEITDQKEVTHKLDKKLKDLSLAQKEFSSLKPKLSLIDEALPQNSEPAILLGQIEVLAQENNLEFASAQSGGIVVKGTLASSERKKKAKEKSPHPSFNTTLSFIGTYEEIESFLESLSNLRRMVNIKNISIRKGKKTSSRTLNLKIDLEIYHLPPS